jgi:ketosteroid isomerase-like protein
MTRENIERLRPVYAEWANGNFHAGGELFAPGMLFRTFDAFEDEELTYYGAEGTQDFMRQFLEQWDDFRIEAKRFVPNGDSVFVECYCSGTGRRSGARVGMEVFAVWTFQGEQATEVRWLRDRDVAREAAGLGA